MNTLAVLSFHTVKKSKRFEFGRTWGEGAIPQNMFAYIHISTYTFFLVSLREINSELFPKILGTLCIKF